MARTDTWLHNSGSARRYAKKFRAADGHELFIEGVFLDAESSAAAAVAATGSNVNTPSSIPAGATGVGAGIDLAGTRMCGFIIGAAWVAGTLSWNVSIDGSTYVPLYNPADNSLVTYQVSAGRAYSVDPALYAGWRFIQPKSSVNQTGGATVTIAAQAL